MMTEDTMTRFQLVSAAALGFLTSCGTATAPQGPRQCDLSFHSALVGQNYGAITLPAGLPVRVISPGDAVTEDFRPERLNLYVDEKGWIQRIECT